MTKKTEWELVHTAALGAPNLWRFPVPGGWLYRSQWGSEVVFVPDPELQEALVDTIANISNAGLNVYPVQNEGEVLTVREG